MIKVLMVCLGNICRSPLAEGILKAKVSTNDVFVDSAGTGGWHVGNLPDKRSIKVAAAYGIDITDQRCRKFKRGDFDEFDYIYVMDNSNYSDIIAMARNQSDKDKVRLILSELGAEDASVPDPYYGGEMGFQNVYKMLDSACDAIVKNRLR